MPQEIELNVVTDTEETTEKISELSQALDDLAAKTEEVGEKTEKTAKRSQSAFGSLFGIFGNLLPRSITSLKRSFDGTQRSLKGLNTGIKIVDKSVKALGTVGFGILLVAVEQIISNWDSIVAFFDSTSESAKTLEEANKRAADSYVDLSIQIDKHRIVVANFNATAEQRQFALEQLKKTMPELNDLTLDEADALSRVNAARQRRLELEMNEAKQRVIMDKLAEAQKEQQDNEITFWDRVLYGANAQIAVRKRQSEAMQTEIDLKAELNNLALEESEWMAQINAELEEQRIAREKQAEAERAAAEAEREAERAREAAIAQAKRDAETRTQILEDLREQAMLDALEGQDRLEKEIELRREAELEKANAVNASTETINLINAKYDAQQDERMQAELDRIQAIEDARRQSAMDATEQIDMALMEGEELEVMREAQKWDKLLDLAVEYGLETEELEKRRQEAIAAISDKYRDKEEKERDEKLAAEQAAKDALYNQSIKLFDAIGALAERDSKLAKTMAVTSILLEQGKAIASGITKAVQTTPATPGYPFQLAANIAAVLTTILGTFGQVRGILQKADTSMPGGGGGARASAPTQALVPTNLPTPQSNQTPLQAYVVQSQLQGATMQHTSMVARTTL